MQAYLFVHFREKHTPDGEQVYFGLSRDGFSWETVNSGLPVLWSYYGDKGVRDFTVIRKRDGSGFVILATDLSLAYGMRNQYHNSWDEIKKHGSQSLAIWESEDLVNWSEQRLVPLGTEDLGCRWAPDIIYDEEQGDYVVHWSSSNKSDGFDKMGIYYSRTNDFKEFTAPKPLYVPENDSYIDSAIYREDGRYYMFVKGGEPGGVKLLSSGSITGEYTPVKGFAKAMEGLDGRHYEAPTAVRLEDGKYCLFLDFFGTVKEKQGYVPFIADSLAKGEFVRSDKAFSFPYGFKHGTILTITEEEYRRIKEEDKWQLKIER